MRRSTTGLALLLAACGGSVSPERGDAGSHATSTSSRAASTPRRSGSSASMLAPSSSTSKATSTSAASRGRTFACGPAPDVRCDPATQICVVVQPDELGMCSPAPTKCIGDVTCVCIGWSSTGCEDQDGGTTIFITDMK